MICERIKKHHLNSFQQIILGFIGVILFGTLLLMLPVSTASGELAPFGTALFTATSAVCVTGLVVVDTATYWSLAGQIIILCLIQIGGLGVISVAAALALLSGHRFSLMQRSTMQEALAAPSLGGIVRLTRFLLKGVILIELLGAVALLPVFLPDFGARGIFLSLFHGVSAFCNAGFDLMGQTGALYPSFTGYRGNLLLNGVLMLLIITGGIGFLTWEDIVVHRWHFRRYRVQTKVVLVTTAALIFLPGIFFYFDGIAAGGTACERWLAAFFQSVTARTAGFNTVDLTEMSSASRMLLIILMLIGGSPGSTAGGIKTTTFAVLVANAFATFHRKDDVHFFSRRIDNLTVKNAATILVLYLSLLLVGALLISLIDHITLGNSLYETASAIGTVGLMIGITPELSGISHGILILLMFFGRVGGLTLIYAALSTTDPKVARLPMEKIMVG